MQSPCSGGIDVSERALLSMLEGGKFNKRPVLSTLEQDSYEANALVSELGISRASSRLGLRKSSLKRILQAPAQPTESYDESAPSGLARRYLEKSFGRWNVKNLDPKSMTACLETRSGVRMSVNIPQLISKT